MGPIHYKSREGDSKKCWILLITCLNCRAIATDVLRNLSSVTFLLSLRRFIATFGCPRRILCDNAPAFTTVAKALSTEPLLEGQHKDIFSYCANNRILFKFIPAFSPWQGGAYERPIGIFKNAFQHAIRNRNFDTDELLTFVKESEAICNTRPLTYMTDQADFIPLRPIDFVRPSAALSTPYFMDEDKEWKPQYTTQDDLIRDWRSGLRLLENFWKRWQTEYLTCLRERHQISHPHPRIHHNDKPANGEYVLIHDEKHPRGA